MCNSECYMAVQVVKPIRANSDLYAVLSLLQRAALLQLTGQAKFQKCSHWYHSVLLLLLHTVKKAETEFPENPQQEIRET